MKGTAALPECRSRHALPLSQTQKGDTKIDASQLRPFAEADLEGFIAELRASGGAFSAALSAEPAARSQSSSRYYEHQAWDLPQLPHASVLSLTCE